MLGFGVLDYLKIGAGAAVGALLAFGPVYLYGEHHGRQQAAIAAVKAANEAYQRRSNENAAVDAVDPVRLCVELGGVPDECAAELRGVGEDHPAPANGGLPGAQ